LPGAQIALQHIDLTQDHCGSDSELPGTARPVRIDLDFGRVAGEGSRNRRGCCCAELEQRPGRVVDKQVFASDVPSQHRVGCVAGLLTNFPDRHTRLGRARREPGAEAVAGIATGIDPGRRYAVFNDQGNGLGGHPAGLEPAVVVNGPEHRAIANAGTGQPVLNGRDRAPPSSPVRNADLPPRTDLVGLGAA